MPAGYQNTFYHLVVPVIPGDVAEKSGDPVEVIKDHITSTLPDTLNLLQFAYRTNISTDYAITITLHTALSHLDKRNTYICRKFTYTLGKYISTQFFTIPDI